MRLAKTTLVIGPLLWVSTVQYFLAQYVVAHAWNTPFSLSHNTISDLGNTQCGLYAGRSVCSPKHVLMNISFILLGFAMTYGAITLRKRSTATTRTTRALWFLGIAGAGTILVGIFPENSPTILHAFGAAIAFAFGGIGIILVGRSMALPRSLRWYSYLTGGISLTALALFATKINLGLGSGTIERITGYPQTIWFIIIGLYLLVIRSKYSRT